jgi:hypothetical protein
MIHYSWTALMPITTEGNWISLWFGQGARNTMRIPYGKVILLQSDMVHSGVMPKVEGGIENKTFG